MNHLMKLRFDDASITDLEDINPSFASGNLKVMYTGDNPNGTNFSKEVIEAALPTIRNVPIVAHYDAEENEIGSHDMEVVADREGNLRLRNLTEPCGVVPESAEATFTTENDSNGVAHEYLNISPVILWKRQEVYRHIVNDLDGRVDHSMEVNITAYHKEKDSSVVTVDAFEFQALCLLESAKPCFAGSELELYSVDSFKEKMEEMMAELKETYSLGDIQVNAHEDEIDINVDSVTKGGRVLDEKLSLIEEYAIDKDTLDFSLDDFSLEELREKFEAMKEEQAEAERVAKFELSSNMRKALSDALQEKTVQKYWGEYQLYWLEDFDMDAGMVYACNCDNYNIYGFSYSMNGDAAVIDFESGKRMKRAFVEYDEGADDDVIAVMFADIEKHYTENETQLTEKYNAVSEELSQLKEATADIDELRKFKADAESAELNAKREAVFAQFEDLAGVEAFENLRQNCADYELDALEEKCYAIRGRNGFVAKFSAEEKPTKIVVDTTKVNDDPYGGIVQKYGAAARE